MSQSSSPDDASPSSPAPESRPALPIYFATTSSVKYSQYALIFKDYGIEIRRGTAITSVLVEPQADYSLDPTGVSVVSHPLRQAARFVARAAQLPYMIEDTMLFVGALSKDIDRYVGLPGADTKNWWHNLGAEGVLRLLRENENRRAAFACQLGVYLGGSKYVFARASLSGSISHDVRLSQVARDDVPVSNPFFFHGIFVPEGDTRTLAEMPGIDFSHFDYRRKCVQSLLSELLRRGASLEEDRQLRLNFDVGG